MVLGSVLLHLLREIVAADAGLVHVGAVDDGLAREEAHFLPHCIKIFVIRRAFKRGGHAAGIEVPDESLHNRDRGLGVLAALGELDQLLETLLDRIEVGKKELRLNGRDVAQRIDGAVHVGDVLVLEAAHHLDDGGALADVGQELVAQSLTLARALDEAGDVDEIDEGVNGFFRLGLGRQRVHAGVRHGNSGLVGLDGAEGIVGGLSVLGLGQGVEKSGLAHVGQADDTNTERHVFSRGNFFPNRAGYICSNRELRKAHAVSVPPASSSTAL